VKIPGSDWKRDTRWTWYPTSKTDPKLLEVHVVDLFKDHLSNDALKAVRWDDKDVPVQNLILADKVKS